MGGSGEPRPGIALPPAPPPCRLWWVPRRRALSWAIGHRPRWLLWRGGSCLQGRPQARLLLVSEGLPVGSQERSQKQSLPPVCLVSRPSTPLAAHPCRLPALSFCLALTLPVLAWVPCL